MFAGAIVALPATASAIEGRGVGHAPLRLRVDAAVDELMHDQKIVGMTVAVTRKGKLLLSRGYGVAKRRGTKVTTMSRSHRTPIGSVGKAVTSGPSLWIAAKHKGVPRNRRPYGPFGLLRSTSNDEVSIAISQNDRVYSWGADGKVRRGSSRELDRYEVGREYTMPGGKPPKDVVAMAISKNSTPKAPILGLSDPSFRTTQTKIGIVMSEKPTYEELEQEVDALRRTISENSYLERIYHSIDLPIVILDRDQTIFSANLSTAKTSGLAIKKILGKKCYQIFHDPNATSPPDDCPFNRVIADGNSETVKLEEEGLQGTFLVSLTPVM
jgi:PAS domain-containing protein